MYIVFIFRQLTKYQQLLSLLNKKQAYSNVTYTNNYEIKTKLPRLKKTHLAVSEASKQWQIKRFMKLRVDKCRFCLALACPLHFIRRTFRGY